MSNQVEVKLNTEEKQQAHIELVGLLEMFEGAEMVVVDFNNHMTHQDRKNIMDHLDSWFDMQERVNEIAELFEIDSEVLFNSSESFKFV